MSVLVGLVVGGLTLANLPTLAAAPRSQGIDLPIPPDAIASSRVITIYMPIIANDWPGSRSQWRFGFVVHIGRGQVTDYEVGLLRAGWYYD
ncbi:MAG: hypothetical protein RMK79_13770, partial [Anaerolineae bacterium]|nr:hypothetical protein [Anaerolineae bacterium]